MRSHGLASGLALVLVMAFPPGRAAAEPAPKKAVARRMAPLPCPKKIQSLLRPRYSDEQVDPDDIHVGACVWGNYGQPGWIVHHHIPWPPGSQAESAPFGGQVFVTADGKIAASNGQDMGSDSTEDVRALDLDGDGVDEIITQTRWSSSMSPESGESLVVQRVTGDKIEEIFSRPVSYEVSGGPGSVRCGGRVTFRTRPGGGKQIVLTGSTPRGKGEPSDRCPAVGKHVFEYAGGEIKERP
jgi:hypothetical protein